VSELQQNRYDQILRRVGDLKGAGSKVANALTELFPTIDVELVPGELLLLGGTALAVGSSVITAIAAQRPAIQLFNPAQSSKLLTVTAVYVSSGTGQQVRWSISTTALLNLIVGSQFRDSRLGVGGIPSGQVRDESKAATVVARGQARVLSGDTLILKDDNAVCVLAPGTGLEVGGANVATTLNVAFDWRERVAEPSELNF